MASQSYKILISAKDKASGTFKSLNKVAGSTSKVVGGLAKGVAAAGVAITAAGVAIAAIARSSFEFADAIGKVSTRTGIATDTVQAFQIAAIESGSSLEVANKSLEKFTRSVGDAQRGLKTQADIFKDLGVEITDVNGATKDMDVLLREVADGFASLESQSEKATVSANLFGRAGIQIMTVLDQGGAAFDDFIDKAKAYGLILDDEGIRASEAFNDTLALINRQFKTATASISIAFLPILQSLATHFKEAFAATTTAEGGVMQFGITIRDTLLNAFIDIIRTIADFLDTLDNLSQKILGNTRLINNFVIRVQQMSLGLQAVSAAGTGFANQAIRLTTDMMTLNSEILSAEDILNNLGITFGKSGDTVRGFADDIEQRLKKILGETSPEVENLIDSINKFVRTASTGVTDLGSPLAVYRDSLTDTQTKQKDLENVQVNAFKNAEDALVSFVKTGKLNFNDLIDSIIADLARLAIRQAIILPIFENMFPSGVGGGSGKSGGGSIKPVGSVAAPIGMEGGGFTGMSARAGGLDGRGGFLAMLHPNETVIDHQKGQSGGVVINQSVNFATGIADTVRNEVLQLLPDIAETSKGAVAEAMQRGGNFRRTFR
tara:strand:- start:5794 stop:7611 length:1818 start_codon:yes stop_codon:yes gene_type:complete